MTELIHRHVEELVTDFSTAVRKKTSMMSDIKANKLIDWLWGQMDNFT